jgi:hypothetical protein
MNIAPDTRPGTASNASAVQKIELRLMESSPTLNVSNKREFSALNRNADCRFETEMNRGIRTWSPG